MQRPFWHANWDDLHPTVKHLQNVNRKVFRIGAVRYNWPVSAHASQAFSIAHCKYIIRQKRHRLQNAGKCAFYFCSFKVLVTWRRRGGVKLSFMLTWVRLLGIEVVHVISSVVSSCFYQLRRVKSSLKLLPFDTARTVVNSFVISRIDYCNSLLANSSPRALNRLQRVLNAAARLVCHFGRLVGVEIAAHNAGVGRRPSVQSAAPLAAMPRVIILRTAR